MATPKAAKKAPSRVYETNPKTSVTTAGARKNFAAVGAANKVNATNAKRLAAPRKPL